MSPSSFTLDEVLAVIVCTLDTLRCLTLSSMDFSECFTWADFLTDLCRWLQDVLDAPLIIMLTDGKCFHFHLLMSRNR